MRKQRARLRVAGIIFDLDLTLFDSRQAICDAFSHALKIVGYPVPPRRQIARTIGLTLDAALRHLFPDGMDAVTQRRFMEVYRQYYWGERSRQVPLLPGAAATVEKLAKAGFRLAVATSKLRAPTEELLADVGLRPFFLRVISSYDVSAPKPAPDVMLEGARQLGLPPARCVVVGDSPYDLAAGRAAGARTVGVLTGAYSRSELKRETPDRIVRDVRWLPRILELTRA